MRIRPATSAETRLILPGPYDWHDHRIHWMSKIDPPKVRAAKDEAHHVFDWTVPATVGSEQIAIKWRLDYKPPPKRSFNTLLIAPLIAFVLAGGILWWARRRRPSTSSGRS
jgi:hypothetical protein